MESGPPPVAIDRAALTPVVRRILGSTSAEVEGWEVRSRANAWNPVTGGLFVVTGTARVDAGLAPRSVVLKVCRNPAADQGNAQTHTVPRASGYRKREYLAYSSGLLEDLPGALRAPLCFGADERGAGEAWLWLEELTDAHAGPLAAGAVRAGGAACRPAQRRLPRRAADPGAALARDPRRAGLRWQMGSPDRAAVRVRRPPVRAPAVAGGPRRRADAAAVARSRDVPGRSRPPAANALPPGPLQAQRLRCARAGRA
jgi:hypothetical protein